MRRFLPLLACTMALSGCAASLPKYVGTFYGDGNHLTNMFFLSDEYFVGESISKTYILEYVDPYFLLEYKDGLSISQPLVFDSTSKTFTLEESVVASGSVTASNFIHTSWKWIDALATGSAIFGNPSGNPPVLTQIPGSNYFGYAYYPLDRGYFTVQGAHKIATTNAVNPALYFEPHCHVMITNNSAGTNIMMGLELSYAPAGLPFTNFYSSTNTIIATNTYTHRIISFGNVTNNLLNGKSSVIWKGRIIRVNSGDGDVGATSPVWIDSIDLHIPVQELGSVDRW